MNKNSLNSKIRELEQRINVNDEKQSYVIKGRIDILYWFKNNDNFRTEEEIKNKIQRYNEELLVFNNEYDLQYIEKKARIDELENLLSNFN